MYLRTLQPILDMLLLTFIISSLGLAEAEAFIAFDQVSCTSGILPFVQAEVQNALQLVLQTAAWLQPPLYDEIIQGYVGNLFGPGDPVVLPRSVFSGLLEFNTTFVDKSELGSQEDLVSTVTAWHPLYN